MSKHFERVTREEPCAVCGHPDWCARLTKYHLCMRVESEKPTKKGGWLHAKDTALQDVPLPPPRRRVPDEELRDRFTPIVERAILAARETLPELSEKLGVDTKALELLQVGYSYIGGNPAWIFPERNARGWIIGLTRRLVAPRDGRDKLCVKGGRRGLSYCDGWEKYPGPIWIVEGASDTAAGLSLGGCVLGRPQAPGGVDILAELLSDYRDNKIIVLGENDQKDPEIVKKRNPKHPPSCLGCLQCFPGKAGAATVSKALSERLNKNIGWMLPPGNVKDLREWLQSTPSNERERHAAWFQSGRLCAPSAYRS